MNDELIIERLDKLLESGKKVEKTQFKHVVGRTTYMMVDNGRMSGFRSACLSFIELFYGKRHSHFIEFEKTTRHGYLASLAAGIGIMIAIKDEIQDGWLTTYKGIVSAEIFTNFIEMAEHLLEQGYKDPAAVVLGSVLEEHLRQLCTKAKIKTKRKIKDKLKPKKAEILNTELAKAKIYNVLDQKSVTSWLDLRNKAAHGKYEEYTKEQVFLMLQSLLNFMSRNKI